MDADVVDGFAEARVVLAARCDRRQELEILDDLEVLIANLSGIAGHAVAAVWIPVAGFHRGVSAAPFADQV